MIFAKALGGPEINLVVSPLRITSFDLPNRWFSVGLNPKKDSRLFCHKDGESDMDPCPLSGLSAHFLNSPGALPFKEPITRLREELSAELRGTMLESFEHARLTVLDQRFNSLSWRKLHFLIQDAHRFPNCLRPVAF